jgi:hypothetical protein
VKSRAAKISSLRRARLRRREMARSRQPTTPGSSSGSGIRELGSSRSGCSKHLPPAPPISS